MLRYILIRMLLLIPILICVCFIIFTLMDLVPGDIIDTLDTTGLSQDDILALREYYGLDRPLLLRFFSYMGGLVQGDLGISQSSARPIWGEFISRFPRTLELAIIGLVLGVSIAIPLGILAAKYAGTILDNIITVFSLFGFSAPPFLLALLLMVFLSVDLKLLPAAYDGTWKCYVMPATTSALIMAASIVRQTRSSVLEVKRQDYLRTARSKGVSELRVTTRHAMRNAWIPIITQIGLTLSRMLAGSAVIESVYSWPGVGAMTVDAVARRDTTLATGCVMLTAIMYVLLLLIVDLVYGFVDPRIKAQYAPVRRKRTPTRMKVRGAA